MVNQYLRVFSFSRNSRGFWILLRSQWPNNPFNGSWSVTTMMFGQPIQTYGIFLMPLLSLPSHFLLVHIYAQHLYKICCWQISGANLQDSRLELFLTGHALVEVESPPLLCYRLEQGKLLGPCQTLQYLSRLGQL